MAKKTKVETLKPPRTNRGLEFEYAKRLKKLTKQIVNSFYYWTIATLNKNMNKNISKQLAFNFDDLLNDWNKKTDKIAKIEASRVTKKAKNFVNSNLASQNKDFALKRSSKKLDNVLNASYERNYNLIKTIPQQIKNDFESIFLNDVNNFDQEAIYKRVKNIEGISSRRATVIARDQVSKALDSYHSTREEDLGFVYYMWQSSKDSRVSTGVGGHEKLEGRIYRYDTPTAVIDSYKNIGHPSQRVNCRCRRKAIILKPNQEVKLQKDVAGDYYVVVEK